MNSARRIKLRLTPPKPRNPLVAAAVQRKAGSHRKSQAAQRKAGSHRKSQAAQRRSEKMALKKQLKEL
jgi:hypothetical protein